MNPRCCASQLRRWSISSEHLSILFVADTVALPRTDHRQVEMDVDRNDDNNRGNGENVKRVWEKRREEQKHHPLLGFTHPSSHPPFPPCSPQSFIRGSIIPTPVEDPRFLRMGEGGAGHSPCRGKLQVPNPKLPLSRISGQVPLRIYLEFQSSFSWNAAAGRKEPHHIFSRGSLAADAQDKLRGTVQYRRFGRSG